MSQFTTVPEEGLDITVQLYKASGQWHLDETITLPAGLRRYELADHLVDEYYALDNHKWHIVVHMDSQLTFDAEEFIMYPELVDLGQIGGVRR